MKWLILLSWEAEGFLQRIQRHHLTTDPACVRYVAPRPGSILDRWSRGLGGLACSICRPRPTCQDHNEQEQER